MGKGEKSPLCDPGSELLLGGSARESSARITNEMEGDKKKVHVLIESRLGLSPEVDR